MKFTRPSSLLALAAASTASAQSSYTNQSAPFTLQIANAANSALNGLYFFACHAGAAIEGLCVGDANATPTASTTFYFNTTDTDNNGGATSDPSQGVLVWNLPVSGLEGIDHASQVATFPYQVGTNVVVM